MKFDSFIKSLHSKRPSLAVLVDPDKFSAELIKLADENGADCFLVGGSHLQKNNIRQIVSKIKKLSKIPVILFPGDEKQLSKNADGLLLLSLISGRNPEYLIEKHVRAAPVIRKMKLPYLSTAYVLIDGGRPSTTQKVTGTKPISRNNLTLIKNTCIAGEQLGFNAIYLEAGSGAKNKVPAALVKKIKQSVNIPVIVGGGIDSGTKAAKLAEAGANMIVVGNALEKKMHLISEISKHFNL